MHTQKPDCVTKGKSSESSASSAESVHLEWRGSMLALAQVTSSQGQAMGAPFGLCQGEAVFVKERQGGPSPMSVDTTYFEADIKISK